MTAFGDAGIAEIAYVAAGRSAWLPRPRGRGAEAGRVMFSAAQLRINQRIAQAAVRRLNALVVLLERGLPGSSFAPGSIRAADLAPELRR